MMKDMDKEYNSLYAIAIREAIANKKEVMIAINEDFAIRGAIMMKEETALRDAVDQIGVCHTKQSQLRTRSRSRK